MFSLVSKQDFIMSVKLIKGTKQKFKSLYLNSQISKHFLKHSPSCSLDESECLAKRTNYCEVIRND